jgi:hypothetical protein
MSEPDFSSAMKDPGRAFGSPEALEASRNFSDRQKHAILLQWKDQLQQLMVATEENMPGPETNSGVNADCLRRIVDALSRLGAAPGGSSTA